MAIETVLGALRQVFVPPDSMALARQAGVVAGSLIILALAWRLSSWIGVRTQAAALAIGVGWVVLTVSFEVGLGSILDLSWSQILADYDLRRGGLMALGLLVMSLAPWIALRLRH